MIPEGRDDAITTSLYTFTPALCFCNDDLVTIGVSFFRDQKDVVYLNVHLSPFDSESGTDELIEKLYEKLFVGCVCELEDQKP